MRLGEQLEELPPFPAAVVAVDSSSCSAAVQFAASCWSGQARRTPAPRTGKACGGRPEQSRAGKGKRGAEVLCSGGTVVALVSRIAAFR